MKRIANLHVGWINTSIATVLQSEMEVSGPLGHMLVTSIDSSHDLSGVTAANEITRRYPECRFLGESLVLPSDVVAHVVATFNLFTGFDEVWWFDEEPIIPKPMGVSLVAPLNLATDEMPMGLSEWMQESKCKLGLGDGIGLNFATPDEAVARLLEQVVPV